MDYVLNITLYTNVLNMSAVQLFFFKCFTDQLLDHVKNVCCKHLLLIFQGGYKPKSFSP